jgi:uncharacterized zinc-type alcohol dehydrogenase-like protein
VTRLVTGTIANGAGIITLSRPEARNALEFCAEKHILPITETITIQDIARGFDRMERNDIKHRFVIDTALLAAEQG